MPLNFNNNSKNDTYKRMEDFIEKFINKSNFLEKYEFCE